MKCGNKNYSCIFRTLGYCVAKSEYECAYKDDEEKESNVMNINFNSMSIDELNKLIANANAEIKQRTESKGIELLNNIIEALKAFEKDFPSYILYEEEGDYTNLDATDILRKIENFNDFT